jgi:hypothetical protein
MKLSDRVDAIERAVIKHLEESGEIRGDIKWLKHAFWAMVGLLPVLLGIERIFRG